MDFNLPSWLFTWSQLFFIAYVLLAVAPASRLLFDNNRRLTKLPKQLLLHFFGKVGLDIALIMGVSGTAIAMMGSLMNDQSGVDAYFQATYVIGTLFFGAVITGLSYCINYPELKASLIYQLSVRQSLAVIGVVTTLVGLQMVLTGLNFGDFWTAGWLLLWQLLALGVWGLLASVSGKPALRCLIEANVATTFVFLALGIVFWFSEGGDYLASRINIFVVARTLFVGSFIHIVIYYVALARNETEAGDYKLNTWHFAEATSFFVFLVLAPVGLTEFSRESKDQAALQAQHEAQQEEIVELKRRIESLSSQSKDL